jgi:hypothetical protein
MSSGRPPGLIHAPTAGDTFEDMFARDRLKVNAWADERNGFSANCGVDGQCAQFRRSI